MAWTAKTERFGVQGPKHATPDRIGPGAYLGHESLNVEHAYAPFGSIKPRDGPGTSMCGAAPGAYDPQIPKKHDSGLPRREVAFGSSDNRDGPKLKFAAPGPGTYAVMHKFPLPQPNRTMGEPQKEKRALVRASSAPSIPQSHQSYGYDEVGDGRLMRQGAKDGARHMTGRTGDSAGPGEYEVPLAVGVAGSSVLRNTVGGPFMRSDRSKPLELSDAPGPGHYVIRTEAKGNVVRGPMISSSFVSQSDSRPSLKSADQPGPGQYKTDRVAPPNLREQHAELQYFGSTCERFKDLEVSRLPGPGEYPQPPKRLKPAPKPFLSSTGRFQAKAGRCAETPGPGSYAPATESSTSGPLGTVSILGAMGGLAFGSMERRGGSLSDKKASDPGPGYYEAPTEFHDYDAATDPDNFKYGIVAAQPRPPRKTAPRVPSFVFKSGTAKDIDHKITLRASKSMPAPGAYDPVHARDTPQVVRLPPKSEGFLSVSQRFNYSVKGKAPGPGNYDPVEPKGGKVMDSFNRTVVEGVPSSGRPRGLGFHSQDQRFSGQSKPWKQTPGPGQYNTEPGWITRTHNVYFGDLT